MKYTEEEKKIMRLYYIGIIAVVVIIGFQMFLSSYCHATEAAVQPEAGLQCGLLRHANGLVEIQYDVDGDGRADHFTLSRLDRRQDAEPFPLFYAADLNQDGMWDAVWVDPEQDGVNGNERLYFGQ